MKIELYSPYIEEVSKYIESKDFKVIQFSNELPKDVSGRIYYDKKEIHLNNSSAQNALYTILHETGHMEFYLKFGMYKQWLFPRFIRELAANY